jgi:hypothetical protein
MSKINPDYASKDLSNQVNQYKIYDRNLRIVIDFDSSFIFIRTDKTP